MEKDLYITYFNKLKELLDHPPVRLASEETDLSKGATSSWQADVIICGAQIMLQYEKAGSSGNFSALMKWKEDAETVLSRFPEARMVGVIYLGLISNILRLSLEMEEAYNLYIYMDDVNKVYDAFPEDAGIGLMVMEAFATIRKMALSQEYRLDYRLIDSIAEKQEEISAKFPYDRDINLAYCHSQTEVAAMKNSSLSPVQSGTIGNLAWWFINGTLTISGTGEIPLPKSCLECLPWDNLRERITSFRIGNGVLNVSVDAVVCFSLTAIHVDENNPAYASENGILFNKAKTILIYYPTGKPDTDYTIPDSVTEIGNLAFNCSLTSIVIPNSVINIRNRAFDTCEILTFVTIGNSVTNIGEEAFIACYNLISITLPPSVTRIGKGAFEACFSLIAIDVDENNPVYASENGILFNKAKTILIQYPAGKPGTDYVIPDSVTGIESKAFNGCNLASITIPRNITSIGDMVFSDSDLIFIVIPDSVTNIGNEAFRDCRHMASVVIPNSVTSIGNEAFWGCYSLTSVIVPDCITSIESGTFGYCCSLTSVVIPGSVTNIEYHAFLCCEALVSVTNWNPIPQNVSDNIFEGVDLSRATLYVPAGAVEAYQNAPVWKEFRTIMAFPAVIEKLVSRNRISLYINPVTESFHIDDITVPTQVIVEDLTGRTVWKQIVSGNEAIAVGHLPRGAYFVWFNEKVIKVIKQ
jgi:hypothetical protein